MNKTTERAVNVDRVEDLILVFGSFDENIKRIEEALGVIIVNRGNELRVKGDAEAVDKAVRTLEGLLQLASKGETIDEQRVRYLITLVQEGNDELVQKMAKDVVCITAKGKPIKAKTVGQKRYIEAISKNTVVFGIGPAGTGKTFLAVAMAVKNSKRPRKSEATLRPNRAPRESFFCLNIVKSPFCSQDVYILPPGEENVNYIPCFSKNSIKNRRCVQRRFEEGGITPTGQWHRWG